MTTLLRLVALAALLTGVRPWSNTREGSTRALVRGWRAENSTLSPCDYELSVTVKECYARAVDGQPPCDIPRLEFETYTLGEVKDGEPLRGLTARCCLGARCVERAQLGYRKTCPLFGVPRHTVAWWSIENNETLVCSYRTPQGMFAASVATKPPREPHDKYRLLRVCVAAVQTGLMCSIAMLALAATLWECQRRYLRMALRRMAPTTVGYEMLS